MRKQPPVLSNSIMSEVMNTMRQKEAQKAPRPLERHLQIIKKSPETPISKSRLANNRLVRAPWGVTRRRVVPLLVGLDTNAMFREPGTHRCHWDLHEFTGVPFVIPTRYDERRDVYHVRGIYCSANCAKAEILSGSCGAMQQPMLAWFGDIVRRYYKMGFRARIMPAPSRLSLKMFRGPYEIEEFRNKTAKDGVRCMFVIAPFVVDMPRIEESSVVKPPKVEPPRTPSAPTRPPMVHQQRPTPQVFVKPEPAPSPPPPQPRTASSVANNSSQIAADFLARLAASFQNNNGIN